LEARPLVDETGAPGTIARIGRVFLVRALGDGEQKGADRLDVYLVDEENADDEVRLGDMVYSLQEHGAEPAELEVKNRDVRSWLAPVLLALAEKCTPEDPPALQ
jgi:hypothetical protein